MSGPLAERTAVVTGAAGGIGRATCLALARDGAAVVAVDRDADALTRTVEEFEATGVRVIAHPADVTVGSEVAGYVAGTLERFGSLDVFVNNAGIEGTVAPLAEYPEDDFDRVIAVNLRGVFLGLRHVLPVMIAAGRGAVVNTGSLASERGLPLTGAYNAAKHGVLGLTRTAAAEVGPAGVRVNAVLPGMIDTGMLRSLADRLVGTHAGAVTEMSSIAPLGRPGTPEDVADVIAFLCGDGARFVHGVGWPVDGGILATLGNTG